MNVSSDQIRAARALLRLEQSELASRTQVSVVTIRRIETMAGHERVTAETFEGIRRALEQAGAEFIVDGVRRRPARRQDADSLFEDLRDISLRSADRLSHHRLLTDADLYDEDGLPS